MNKQEAYEFIAVQFDEVHEAGIMNMDPFIVYDDGADVVTLDGEFTADQLEALAAYMKGVQINGYNVWVYNRIDYLLVYSMVL